MITINKLKQFQMSRVWAALLLLCFVCVPAACYVEGDCFGEDCEFSVEGSPQEFKPATEVVPLVEKQLRRAFWYYLRKSDLIYQANIDTPDQFLLIFIFRNVVGTFLSIGKWNKLEQSAEIATFVRLGNGYAEDAETRYSPVKIDPFIISLRLNKGEYLIQVDQKGDFVVNGELFEVDNKEEVPEVNINQRVECVDSYIRSRYWYYLGGRDPALLLHAEPIATNRRTYVVANYVNIVGHFLVIASCNGSDTVIVHTFVRLGNGYMASQIEEVPPVELKPSVQELNW